MLYTGFREIDDKIGGVGNGELVVVASDFVDEYVQQYILYNLAKQIDTQNRKNIKNYNEKITDLLNFENVEFEKPIEKVIVFGRHDLEFNTLSGFPRGEYDTERFDLFTKRRLLFKNLPIEQGCAYLHQRSANALIKDITHTYEDIKTQISAICVFGWEKKIPMLKEVAQKLNIPVLLLTYTCGYDEPLENEIKKYQSQAEEINKLAIIKNNYWDEKYKDTPNKNTSTFYVNNLKTGFTDTFVSKYHPDVFLKFPNELSKCHLSKTTSLEILRKMAQDSKYINQHNFSKYMHLSHEKNKQFWAYIEVFQRIQINDLYELLAEYKKNVSRQEQMLAAEILHKLLVEDTDNKKPTVSSKIASYTLPDNIQF